MGFTDTRSLGLRAEQRALRFLQDAGLDLVTKNYRIRGGEIDLIMLHDGCLAFIEVRYRRSEYFVPPALSVDPRKQRKLLRTAAIFLAREKRFAHHRTRFDVVAITGDSHGSVNWVQDAFRPGDSIL